MLVALGRDNWQCAFDTDADRPEGHSSPANTQQTSCTNECWPKELPLGPVEYRGGDDFELRLGKPIPSGETSTAMKPKREETIVSKQQSFWPAVRELAPRFMAARALRLP